MLYRLYGKAEVARLVTDNSKGDTLAHKAAKNGMLSLVLDEMIDQLGFDVDYWQPSCRLTLINQVVKHRQYAWSDSEKS